MSVPACFEYLANYRMTTLGSCIYNIKSLTASVLMYFNTYFPHLLTLTATVIIILKFFLANRRRKIKRDSAVVAVAVIGSRPVVAPSANMTNRRKRISKMLVVTFLFSLTCQVPLYIFILSGANANHPISVLYLRFLTVIQFTSIPVGWH
jgi:hypothetical protein